MVAAAISHRRIGLLASSLAETIADSTMHIDSALPSNAVAVFALLPDRLRTPECDGAPKTERRTAMGFERPFCIYPASSCSPTRALRLYSSLHCANRSAVSLAFADRSLFLDDRHVGGISVCHCAQPCTRQCRRQLRQSVHFPHSTRAK